MDSHRRSAQNTFANLPIDRFTEQRDDPDWLVKEKRDPNTRFIDIYKGECKVINQHESYRLALDTDTKSDVVTISLLGTFQNHTVFSRRQAPAENEAWLNLRSAAIQLSDDQAGLAAYAIALDNWQQRHEFCGRCGNRNRLLSAGHRMECGSCRNINFPRTDPAMITLITYGDECLLGRQSSWPAKRYSCLAGFVEPGESLEDCVRREAMEEAGVSLARIDYQSSQPWPFPNALMAGFRAIASSQEISIGDELEDARWWSIEAIQQAVKDNQLLLPFAQSISWRLLADWYREKTDLDLNTLNTI